MARKKKFELNDNNLAIAYYRFSSHSQNEASIDQQRELAHAWADAHGFKIVKEYEDAAISGTTENRPGFQQMLSEVAKIRPRVLIMWKTDRLGRDKYVLAMAKRTIRDAGCEIRLLAENIPTDGPEGVLIEGLMDAMAEYYSRQLSQNIQRGMDYNAQHALYNGHKLFGYGVDKSTKRYIVNPDTAPFVQRMFAEYAEGKAMQTICDELNAQGLRTTRGAKFGVKTLNKMLQNRAYIGEYRHGDIVVEGGMPALVDEETFDKVQRKFAENKRKGSQRARGMDENDAPRYWLTGKVYCGKCGNTLQGVSGTSGTGRTYYYYYCSAQRRKQCTLKKVRKEKLEDAVTMILRSILHDSENLMSLAVDAAAYYEKNYRDTGYLDGLEAKRREVEKSLANLVKVIESGLISETVTERLVQLEEQKRALNEAIEAENIRAALCEDEHTIKAYFEKFLHADFDNPETRDQVLEYFVDKIYLTDDGLVVTSWYSEDRTEVTWDMLYGEDGNPFVKGEAVKFDCFPFGSSLDERTVVPLYWDADMVIRNDSGTTEDCESWKPLLEDLRTALASCDGVADVHAVEGIPFTIADDAFAAAWLESYAQSRPYLTYDEVMADYTANPTHYYGMMKAIDAAEFEHLNAQLAEPLDKQAFLDGAICFVNISGGIALPERYLEGVPLTIEVAGQRLKMHIVAESSNDSSLSASRNLGPNIIVSQEWLAQQHLSPLTLGLTVHYEVPGDAATEERVQRLLAENAGFDDIFYQSHYEEVLAIQATEGDLNETGAAISLLLLIVGGLNYVNTMAASIQSRRLKFLIMESLGMTPPQLRCQLVIEGLFIALGVLMLTATLGMMVNYLVFQMMNYANVPFQVPFAPIVGAALLVMLLCVVVPLACYRRLGDEGALIERLRMSE